MSGRGPFKLWTVEGYLEKVEEIAPDDAPRLIDYEVLAAKRASCNGQFCNDWKRKALLTVKTTEFVALPCVDCQPNCGDSGQGYECHIRAGIDEHHCRRGEARVLQIAQLYLGDWRGRVKLLCVIARHNRSVLPLAGESLRPRLD